MKILYGIQGTGNGHIERSRIIAKEFQKYPHVQVDYILSGRDKFNDMQDFGNYKTFQGLTFNIKNGKVNLLKTALNANILQFIKDIKSINTNHYDLIISDYEPITAWAAKLNNIPSISISHQAAFYYNIPTDGFNIISKWIMQNFAPTNNYAGLHWHHFNQNILPPIIDTSLTPHNNNDNNILVYLPNENQSDIAKILQKVSYNTNYNFNVFSNDHPSDNYPNVTFHKTSHYNFKQYLKSCNGIICNAGFELVSEGLHLNKRILVKPVHNQAEQLSNAKALVQLNYGYSINHINYHDVYDWIQYSKPIQITFPNVAEAIVKQIINDKSLNVHKLMHLW